MDSTLNLQFESFSHRGPRQSNEDCVYAEIFENGAVFAVADGVGGSKCGDVASSTVMNCISQSLKTDFEVDFPSLFNHARHALLNFASHDSQCSEMATTLSVCRIVGSRAFVGHVGDSRIFHIRGDGIMRRTSDQTEAEELIRQGVISKARARKYSRRNVLLSSISPKRDFDLHQSQFDLLAGDKVFLTTDGVHSLILTREIVQFFQDTKSPSEVCSSIVREIESRGPTDNYSAICVFVD